jgi:hypothetical protein
MSTDDKLLASLDEAAMLLLADAGVGGIVGEDGPAQAVTLAERVKAFEAVVDWAKTRRVLAPPAKVESQFDAIRNKFNSPPLKRRGAPRSAKAAEADGSADAADPDSGPGSGLFD